MNPDRRPIIAGNWKMNAGGPEGPGLAAAVAKGFKKLGKKRCKLVEVVLAPPFTALGSVRFELESGVWDGRPPPPPHQAPDRKLASPVQLAGQNMHPEKKGAFTGEISASMLKDAGASWVILGHSERRQHFGETDEFVARKVAVACESELRPIVCVGETLEQREAGETLAVVRAQVQAFLSHLSAHPGMGVVAYEPIWAIGTGLVAEPADAQEVHGMIRELLTVESAELAAATRILYGGSVKADNAAGLFAEEDIDGALVGGASLKADGFGKIIAAAVDFMEKAEPASSEEPVEPPPEQ